MIILAKITSRGRPDELLKCIESYTTKAENINNIKWLFSFDLDDYKYNNEDFLEKIRKATPESNIYFGFSNSKIEAINRDIANFKEHWDILVNISDDQLAEVNGWDTEIIKSMPSHLDASLWFNDGRQDVLNTMEIVGRNYYNRFNYIYYPEYKSFFCDNEAQDVALRLGNLIKNKKCIVKHWHYGWAIDTHMKKDETYSNAEKHWKHDEALFKKRRLINYGL
jgi:hypothetical protein